MRLFSLSPFGLAGSFFGLARSFFGLARAGGSPRATLAALAAVREAAIHTRTDLMMGGSDTMGREPTSAPS
jgi:hypothetical protein